MTAVWLGAAVAAFSAYFLANPKVFHEGQHTAQHVKLAASAATAGIVLMSASPAVRKLAADASAKYGDYGIAAAAFVLAYALMGK